MTKATTQTARTLLRSAAVVVDGNAFMENTEDGPVARIWYYVGIEIRGDFYSLSVPGGRYHDAEAMADRINVMGTVNLAKWLKMDPTSREENEAYNLREEMDAGEWSFA